MSEVGDILTTGEDMDLPASPLGPGCPGAPVLPAVSYMLTIKKTLHVLKFRKYASQNMFAEQLSSSNTFITLSGNKVLIKFRKFGSFYSVYFGCQRGREGWGGG